MKEEEKLIKSLNTGPKASGVTEFLCEHKDSGEPLFAHGLCKPCYDDVNSESVTCCIGFFYASLSCVCADWCSLLNFLEALVAD